MATVADAYAQPSDYRTIVNKSDDGDDASVASDLLAISRYLDRTLGRFFSKDAADVTRLYWTRAPVGSMIQTAPIGWAESENPFRWGGWSRHLAIDDLVSVTSIKIDSDNDGVFTDESALAATDYELWPQNALLGPEPEPYQAIYLTPYGAQHGFPVNSRVQVIGKFGWPAVPAAIVRATCHLTGILRLETPRSTSRVNELGERLSTSRQAQMIINDLTNAYRRTLGTAF